MFRSRSNVLVTAPLGDVDLPSDRLPGKRVLWFVTLLIVALVGVRIWWGLIAAHRLSIAIAALPSDWQPASSFSQSPADDPHNAVPLIRHAADALATDDAWEADPVTIQWTNLPLSADARRSLEGVVHAHRDVLPIVRQARKLQRTDWGARDGSWNSVMETLHDLDRLRTVSYFMGCAAIQAHVDGYDAEALERIGDILFLARSTDTSATWVSMAVAEQLEMNAVEKLGLICPHMRIEHGPGSATVEQVREIETQLLDESWFDRGIKDCARRGIRQSLDATSRSRRGDADIFLYFDGAGHPMFAPRWRRVTAGIVAGPFFSMVAARNARHDGAVLEALSQPDWPSVQLHLPPDLSAAPRNLIFGADWLGQAVNSTTTYRALSMLWKGHAGASLAATQLAFRQYELEHDGHLPAALEQLVPRYLGRIPRDVCARAGTPIRYVRNGPRPFVYSVGEDGRDDIAARRWTVPMNLSDDDRWRQLDLVWFLPAVTATTQASQ